MILRNLCTREPLFQDGVLCTCKLGATVSGLAAARVFQVINKRNVESTAARLTLHLGHSEVETG